MIYKKHSGCFKIYSFSGLNDRIMDDVIIEEEIYLFRLNSLYPFQHVIFTNLHFDNTKDIDADIVVLYQKEYSKNMCKTLKEYLKHYKNIILTFEDPIKSFYKFVKKEIEISFIDNLDPSNLKSISLYKNSNVEKSEVTKISTENKIENLFKELESLQSKTQLEGMFSKFHKKS